MDDRDRLAGGIKPPGKIRRPRSGPESVDHCEGVGGKRGLWVDCGLIIGWEERESGTCYSAAKRVIIYSAAGMVTSKKAKPNAARFGFAADEQGVERKRCRKQLETV